MGLIIWIIIGPILIVGGVLTGEHDPPILFYSFNDKKNFWKIYCKSGNSTIFVKIIIYEKRDG